MIINYVPEHFDLEAEEQISQVLIAIRYTGGRSSLPTSKFNLEAAWPGYSPLQAGPEDSDGEGRLPGPPQGGVVPDWTDENVEDRTVESLEADDDVEVLYQPAEIAAAMLETNYLDPNVFGQGFDPDLRDFVFDELGLEDIGVRREDEYRAQLREIAGIDGEDEAASVDDTRIVEYRQAHSRDELVEAARILEHDDPDSLGKIDAAEWLAEQDPAAVRFAFEGKAAAAKEAAGLTDDEDDAPEPEPLTPEGALAQYEYDELKAAVKAVREGTGEFSLHGSDATDMATFLVAQRGLSEDEIDAHITG